MTTITSNINSVIDTTFTIIEKDLKSITYISITLDLNKLKKQQKTLALNNKLKEGG